MSWYMLVAGFLILLAAGTLTYQVYRMTELDARSRGLKHPKFWGFVSIGGQNCGGLILYLIGRKKYISHIDETGIKEIEARKKKIGVALIFFCIAIITMAVGGYVNGWI